MILYTENSKNATRKLIQLVNKFGKATGYKINKQKSLAFLYTNNKRSEREVKEKSHLTLKLIKTNIKYLGINLPKEAKDL